jgi:hypothetical protein
MMNLRSIPQILILTFLVVSAGTPAAESKADADPGPIPYATLAEAEKALRAKPGVKFRNEGGWLVAEDLDAFTVWLLTPVGHPAYPSIVRRALINTADGAHLDTAVRCLASKEVCDKAFGGQ